LPCNTAGGFALLQEAGLIDDKNAVIVSQRLKRIIPHEIAQSIRIRRSLPSKPSRNNPAETATRSCVNKGRMRAFTSRSDEAQSSSVVSIDAPAIHDLQIMAWHRVRVATEMQL
jgi:hypothetical protein